MASYATCVAVVAAAGPTQTLCNVAGNRHAKNEEGRRIQSVDLQIDSTSHWFASINTGIGS